MGGVLLREVSAYGRCPLTRGVRLWEVSAYGRCPLAEFVLVSCYYMTMLSQPTTPPFIPLGL